MGYLDRINFVPKGADATAGNVNTAPKQLQGNVDFVKALVEAALLGQALFARDATLDPAVKAGQPVYWDKDSSSFKQALAGSAISDQGTLIPAPSAEVFGIVASKTNATLGDVLTLGIATIDLSEACDDAVPSGRYYLSGTQPGKLVKSRPAAAVSVLYAYGDGKVLVLPSTRDFLEDHIHYSFELACVPAGVHNMPAVGDIHSISSPDVDIQGWLPANHTSFAGKAPSNAAFGYNLAAHPELNAVWPPIPTVAAILTLDKGVDYVGGTEVPLGEFGLVTIDRYGIWWLSNCYGDVPWPTDYNSGTSHSLSSAVLECPRTEQMSVRLDFIRMSFATDRNVVTELISLSPAIVIECNGNPATTGSLTIQLILDLMVDSELSDGDLVLKGFNGDAQQFSMGAVTEGIVAGSNVTLTGTRTRDLISGDATSATVYQGIVTVAADVDPTGKEMLPVLVRTDDTIERYDGSVMYLSLMPNQETGIRGQLNIPSGGLGVSPTIKLRFTFLATQAGSLPAVVFTAVNVPRPDGPTTLPSGDTTHTLDVGGVGTVAAGDYFEVESDAITVTAGATLFYTLSRAGSDGYAGELGILKHVGVIQ